MFRIVFVNMSVRWHQKWSIIKDIIPGKLLPMNNLYLIFIGILNFEFFLVTNGLRLILS